ncbi:MAG: hypothetical protein UHN47_09455 [Lachnospiraceae bacterium]|nr:hypothetical protein [Lachnospiraceae bacterium]
MKKEYNMEQALLSKYQEIESRGVRPEGAWWTETLEGRRYVKPAIPFVGKNYTRQKLGCKVLLYASAENLSGYGEQIVELTQERGMNRCREAFTNSSDADFFPSVHIQPINDGGLLVAAYQILKKCMGEEFLAVYGEMSPREFLECICCANYGKFTLMQGKGEKNVDCANSKGIDFFESCHEYIKVDIEVLKPDIIIIPSGVYYSARQKELFFDKISSVGNIKIISIYQINAQVVNCTIYPAMMKERYGKIFSEDMLSTNELRWHKGVKRINKEKFLSIYSYINSLNI